MRLYQLTKTGSGSCCSCRGGVIKPHAPLKNKTLSRIAQNEASVSGSGLISKIQPMNHAPIPNTEELQRKLSNLSRITFNSTRRGGKYINF